MRNNKKKEKKLYEMVEIFFFIIELEKKTEHTIINLE